MTDAATRALGRAKELSTTITLAMFVVPLGVVAHAAAFAALPMQLASAMLRELTMSRGTDVRALLRGLYALALKPSLAAACAAEIKDDGEIFREYSRSSSEKIEAFRKMSEIEREKFIAACAKLKEEEQIRERLREQLNATRDELKRERAANFAQGKFSKGKEETGSGGVYLTTALLGVMLLYFHDMDTVHTLDKKLAASIPAFWMFVMTFNDDEVWREPDAAAYVGEDSENVCWPCERACHTATPLSDGDTMIVFGGLSKNSVSLSDTWAWSATELCWSPVEPPSQEPDARFMHTATVVGDGLVVLGGMTLNLKGVDSGKSHRVFDHMYILTGLQLLTHPARKATQGKPNDSPPQRSTRKSFSQEHPEGLPPKKKHSAAVKEMQRKSSRQSMEI